MNCRRRLLSPIGGVTKAIRRRESPPTIGFLVNLLRCLTLSLIGFFR